MCGQIALPPRVLHWDLHFPRWCLMSEVWLRLWLGDEADKPEENVSTEVGTGLRLSRVFKLSLSYVQTEVVPWHLQLSINVFSCLFCL